MADIEAYLIESRNGTAPQHKVQGKNKFEASEGSDGATHTKITDKNGDPIDVKSELESIKQTQSDILDKLNGTIDTQVIGSYAEYRILSSDTFPEAKADEKGAQLIVMDTGAIYLNHGSEWKVF